MRQLAVVFADADALRGDSTWSDYFDAVYGIDTMTFPFSMLPLNFFYVHMLPASVKLDVRAQDIAHNSLLPKDGKGPLVAGDLYRLWGGDKPADVSDLDIWRCIYPVGQPLDQHGLGRGDINFELGHGFPSGAKIEVMHRRGDPAGAVMWFYYAAGSGIYFSLGRTVVFADHSDAARAWGVLDENDLVALANAAIARGYDSVQYTHRKESIYKFEIVAVRLDGQGGCFAAAAAKSFSRGWGGTEACFCARGDELRCLSEDDVRFNATGALPVFRNAQQLRRAAFHRYLQRVYSVEGCRPAPNDFPLDLRTFDIFYLPLLQAVGLVPPLADVSGCNPPDGVLYRNMSGDHDPPGSIWVWRSTPQAVTTREDSWVEVTHCADREAKANEHTAMWCYVAKGSGNFANIGRTIAFPDHSDAAKYFLHEGCDMECTSLFDRIFAAARSQKYDSMLFMRHTDQTCGVRAVELVLLNVGSGAGACPRLRSQFASGWRHSRPCHCDPTQKCLACFPMITPPDDPGGSKTWLWLGPVLGVSICVCVAATLLGLRYYRAHHHPDALDPSAKQPLPSTE